MSPFFALIIFAVIVSCAVAGWCVGRAWLRKKYPWPATIAEPDAPEQASETFFGYYLITEHRTLRNKYRQFCGWGLLVRGNGRLFFTDRGLHFQRALTNSIFMIPRTCFQRVQVLVSPRWKIRGKISLEIDWELQGECLRSVFSLAGGVSSTVRVAKWIQNQIRTA